jgi:PAS domain S-box-containing protein
MGVGDADFAARVWEHSTSGICAVDARGSLVMINAAARRTLGGACATAEIGVPCEQALADYPSLAKLLREALAGRPALSRAELSAERSDGESRVLGLSLTALPGPDGAIGGAAVVFRDLTPIERSGERERLQQRLVALGEMAAGLAHELRNPLAGMEVLAGLLQRRLHGDPDSQALVVDLRAQLRQLAGTVTASLDYLRPVALCREPLDPVELAEEALVLALARAPRPSCIDRRYAVPLPRVDVDRQLLGVALVNLIVNACEAMAETRERPSRLAIAIEVGAAPEVARAVRVGSGESALPPDGIRSPSARCAPDGLPDELRSPSARCAPDGLPDELRSPSARCAPDGLPDELRSPSARCAPDGLPARELRIAVADTGPGISEEIRDRIFDPFFTTRASGSGIGLANVQKIVHAHGGTLSLQSSELGSEFRVHLPLAGDGA